MTAGIAKSSHLDLFSGVREGYASSSKTTPPILLKQLPIGDEVFKHNGLQGPFSSKPPFNT